MAFRTIFKPTQIVSERKLLFSPISASGSGFNPQNTQCIHALKIFAFLELEKTI
jgi:hypothetical protein